MSVPTWHDFIKPADMARLVTVVASLDLRQSGAVREIVRALPPKVPKDPLSRSGSSKAVLGYRGISPVLGKPWEDHECLFGWLYGVKPGLVLHVPWESDSLYCGFLERKQWQSAGFRHREIGLASILGGSNFLGSMTIEDVAESLADRSSDAQNVAHHYARHGIAAYMERNVDRDATQRVAFSPGRWAEMTEWLDHWLPRE